MKLYQFELHLFLLLIIVNTTLSVYIPRFSPSFGKQITKVKGGHPWKKTLDKIKQPSPPSDKQPTIEIQGLSQIKQYFSNVGYLEQTGTISDDVLDKKTISAIKTYQKYFNLQVTGELNFETLQQIALPRCGVPDMNFEFGFSDINLSWPKGNKWFPKGIEKIYFTYGFHPKSEISLDMTKVLRNAFTRWSDTTRVVKFKETSYDDADIKIGFYINFEDVVMGVTFISLKQDSNVMSGEIRLDNSKYWVLPTDDFIWSWKFGQFDLETVAMHQIGHLLGLDHSSDEESIMYPTILSSQQRKVQITVSDNLAIQQLYTNAIKSNANSRYGGLLSSLSLGFAFMVALLN